MHWNNAPKPGESWKPISKTSQNHPHYLTPIPNPVSYEKAFGTDNKRPPIPPSDPIMLQERPNWPSFKPIISYYPEHLPDQARMLINRSYVIWQLTSWAYLLNFITIIVLMIDLPAGVTRSILMPISALLNLIVGPILSFASWHWSLYAALQYVTATRNGQMAVGGSGGLAFPLYFVMFGLQMVSYVLLALGISEGAGGGILTGLHMLANKKWIAAMLCGGCTGLMVTCFILGLFQTIQVIRFYRQS